MNENCKKKSIYICTRIFNYNDKLQAEYLEQALKNRLDYDVFMPFRDTDENNLVGSNRTKIVFDSDIERLNSGEIKLLAVLYDGICKDEGISFEIGYAFGKGIPIFIINTDFIWYAIGKVEFLFDPVISEMASGYLHQYKIEDDISFKEALVKGQNTAFNIAARKIKDLLLTSNHLKTNIIAQENKYDVFLDLGGEKYEYQKEYSAWIVQRFEKYGIKVATAQRYSDDDSLNQHQKGLCDIENLMCSDYFVCLGDESELNSGTAALLGLARCNGKKTILYESSDLEIHGENGHRMKKNLIIDFSIDRIAKSKKEIVEIILEDKNV